MRKEINIKKVNEKENIKKKEIRNVKKMRAVGGGWGAEINKD